jgi:hypothetical protein
MLLGGFKWNNDGLSGLKLPFHSQKQAASLSDVDTGLARQPIWHLRITKRMQRLLTGQVAVLIKHYPLRSHLCGQFEPSNAFARLPGISVQSHMSWYQVIMASVPESNISKTRR